MAVSCIQNSASRTAQPWHTSSKLSIHEATPLARYVDLSDHVFQLQDAFETIKTLIIDGDLNPFDNVNKSCEWDSAIYRMQSPSQDLTAYLLSFAENADISDILNSARWLCSNSLFTMDLDRLRLGPFKTWSRNIRTLHETSSTSEGSSLRDVCTSCTLLFFNGIVGGSFPWIIYCSECAQLAPKSDGSGHMARRDPKLERNRFKTSESAAQDSN